MVHSVLIYEMCKSDVCTSNAVVAEQEAHEQQDKPESQPAAMPDYAAGLLAPSFDVGVSILIVII